MGHFVGNRSIVGGFLEWKRIHNLVSPIQMKFGPELFTRDKSNKLALLGLSATYKEKELFRLRKQTFNDHSTHFIALIVEKLFKHNSP